MFLYLSYGMDKNIDRQYMIKNGIWIIEND